MHMIGFRLNYNQVIRSVNQNLTYLPTNAQVRIQELESQIERLHVPEILSYVKHFKPSSVNSRINVVRSNGYLVSTDRQVLGALRMEGRVTS